MRNMNSTTPILCRDEVIFLTHDVVIYFLNSSFSMC